MKNICVFGASSSRIDPVYIRVAEEFGRLMAENGLDLVFGGGRTGLMGAVSRGVSGGGGFITGIIPEKLNRPGIVNECCDRLVVTATMHERKAKMEAESDGFVVLPGGYGTLEEALEVLTLNQLGYLSAPVVFLNVNGFFDPLLEQFDRCVEGGFTNESFLGLFLSAASPEEALSGLLNYMPPLLPNKMEDALLNR